MDSFKNYVNLHEETKRNSFNEHEGQGMNKTPAQIFSEAVNGQEKTNSVVHQFIVQTEEILTNKRHSFKIEPKSTDNLDNIQNIFITFKEAFDRFLNDCRINRETRQETDQPRR